VVRLTDVIRAEVARGATVVVVSHDEAFADQVAGSRLRLERGRVVDSA